MSLCLAHAMSSSIDSFLYNRTFFYGPAHAPHPSIKLLCIFCLAMWLIHPSSIISNSTSSMKHSLTFSGSCRHFFPRVRHCTLNYMLASHCIEIILLCARPHKTEFLSGMDWTLFVLISSLFSPKYLVFVKWIKHKVSLNRKLNKIQIHFYGYQMVTSS